MKSGDITRALRVLYPRADPLWTRSAGDGRYRVVMPAAPARCMGIGHDNGYAAQWLSRHVGAPLTITEVQWIGATRAHGPTACVYLAEGGAMPPPGEVIPRYAEPAEVLRGLPATSAAQAIIATAIHGGLRPHLDPSGPRNGVYTILLSYPSPEGLFGGIHVSAQRGVVQRAFLCRGNSAPERVYEGVAAVREQIAEWDGLANGSAARRRRGSMLRAVPR